MHRLQVLCLLVSFVEIRGNHKPTDFSGQTRGPRHQHLIPHGSQHQYRNPYANAQHHQHRTSTTRRPDVPFKETDEGNNAEELTIEETFEYLGNKTAKNNNVNKNFCKIHSEEGALEYFTTQNYKLIPLPHDDLEDIVVKIKNNMVYVKGTIKHDDIDARFNKDNNFEAIYKVPDIVDTKRVSWNNVKERLEVTFFYKMQFNKEVTKSCAADYNEDGESRTVRRST